MDQHNFEAKSELKKIEQVKFFRISHLIWVYSSNGLHPLSTIIFQALISKEDSQSEETDAHKRMQTVEEIKQIDMEQFKQKAITEKDLVNTAKYLTRTCGMVQKAGIL